VLDLADFLRNLHVTTIFALEKAMEDKSEEKTEIITALEQGMDGVIQFTNKEVDNTLQKLLLIKKMKGGKIISQEYHPFEFKKGEGMRFL
jgi:DNA phosphorothioation-dependent restriction protein DptG